MAVYAYKYANKNYLKFNQLIKMIEFCIIYAYNVKDICNLKIFGKELNSNVFIKAIL